MVETQILPRLSLSDLSNYVHAYPQYREIYKARKRDLIGYLTRTLFLGEETYIPLYGAKLQSTSEGGYVLIEIGEATSRSVDLSLYLTPKEVEELRIYLGTPKVPPNWTYYLNFILNAYIPFTIWTSGKKDSEVMSYYALLKVCYKAYYKTDPFWPVIGGDPNIDLLVERLGVE